METYRDKYIDFLIKTKGVTREHAKVVTIHLKKVIDFLKEKGIEEIDKIERMHLDEFQETIMKKDYVKSTKRQILDIVRLFFNYLYDYGYIKENPGLVIESPKKVPRIPRTIMNEEEIKFLLTLPNQKDLIGIRDFCIMNLLYSSTVRTKELFNLKLDDADLVRNQAIIKRPKNKRDRIVHFDTYTSRYLKNYITKIRPWLLRTKESSHLFITSTGTNLTRSSWAAHFSMKYKPIMDGKFKKNITPYAFRHSSATHWLDNAAKQKRDILPFIQRQLGHESLESTAIYTHVAIEPLRQMFKLYHPRELSLKNLHNVASPNDIISFKKNKKQPL
ncbi:MAG: tyrosine-type recombinase/integrase [Candidatus Omnitrophota bacterium]